jgi:hypothetical protein
MTICDKIAELRKHSPAKIAEYPDSYNEWSGNPKGYRPDFDRCARVVWPKGSYTSYQCSRACGHGPNGAYCKQHAKNPNKHFP